MDLKVPRPNPPELEKGGDLHDFYQEGKGLKIPHGVDGCSLFSFRIKEFAKFGNFTTLKSSLENGKSLILADICSHNFFKTGGPKLAVALFSLTNQRSSKDLNQLLSHWDFTKIFSSYS